MDDIIGKLTPVEFPLFFAAVWLAASTMLGFVSGWFFLNQRFPDRPDEPAIFKLRVPSGSMGPLAVNMNNILTLAVCRTGLRVAIMRAFGPFQPPFLVPWTNLAVERKQGLFGPRVVLRFGDSEFLRLGFAARIADRLARECPREWPESRVFPAETGRQILLAVAAQWAVTTLFASVFFTVAPRLMAPGAVGLPIPVAILFPAIVFGVGAVIEYSVRMAGRHVAGAGTQPPES